MQKQSHYNVLMLTNGLFKELEKLDNKVVLLEVQLVESRVYYALGNQPKAWAPYTSARTSAVSSGMLYTEDKDFDTVFSSSIEALEGYNSREETRKATSALQYMLLDKIMLNLVDDINNLISSKTSYEVFWQELGSDNVDHEGLLYLKSGGI
ncbi:MAG: hypothetical protein Q9213_006282 [Squamulea squamosa]